VTSSLTNSTQVVKLVVLTSGLNQWLTYHVIDKMFKPEV